MVPGTLFRATIIVCRIQLSYWFLTPFSSHAELAKCAGTSRTRVTAIANGNTHGVSTDVLIRVLAATGHRAEVRVKKAAA